MTTENNMESPSFQQQIEMTNPKQTNAEEQILRHTVVCLNGHILGFVLGIISALIIFAATNILVLKGGEVVGPHLNLLGQFFIGYSVTFLGSMIGAVYGFITSFLSGLLIGWIYNAVVFLRMPKGKK